MTTVDTETPDAQVDEQNPPVDAGEDSTPPSTEETTPPSAAEETDTIRELRNRLAHSGRVTAELRTANSVLANQIAATNQRLEQLGAHLTAREQQAQSAYLASLPPDQREKEELRLTNQRLENRLSALERVGTDREPTEDEKKAATAQFAQQMLDEAAVDFGLDIEGGERIAWNDPRLAGAWASPDEFRRQARLLARKISAGKEPAQPEQGATTVADSKSKGKAAPTAAPSEADIQKRIDEGIQKALGSIGGAPNSPRPAAVVTGRTPDEQAYQDTLRGYSPSAGPKATREALKDQLKKAEAAAAKAGRL